VSLGGGKAQVSSTLATPAEPTSSVRTADRSPTILSAGIVAHNEERNLESAVRSLLDQDLPHGVWWNTLWVVASGCSDRTVEIAEGLSAEDRRVRLVVEPERWGKAHALREVFRRAQGNGLVLLNSDAYAEPGSVAELVRAAAYTPPPFAVMGRPVVPEQAAGRWAGTLRSMWDLHHAFHCELQALGGGSHLSDELLLVSLPTVPPLPEGIVNDGSYIAVWLAQHGGRRLYAPRARVRIEIPVRMRDHLHQRRRIQYGNDQVTAVLGDPPSTLARYALHEPKRAAELVRRWVVDRPNGIRHFAALGTAELAAKTLSLWDRLPPRKDHVRWRRIGSPRPLRGPSRTSPEHQEPSPERRTNSGMDHRVTAVVGVAAQFGTGVPLPELLRLLPEEGPATVSEVRDWLAQRPYLARMVGEAAFAPQSTRPPDSDRMERGRRYLRAAEELLEGPLRGVLPWVRCACVTGSAAYGEPNRGDDLDLFVVTREGSLWWFLAYTYLAVRAAAWRRVIPPSPVPCFNFVVDDRRAIEEFSGSRGFLFAREALTARPVQGEDYYRGLLANAPWMAEEIPRLYAERKANDPVLRSSPSSWAVRLLSAALFPWLAGYLQIVGLRRDARYRVRRVSDHRFRTETRWRRLAFASRRFEQIRDSYRVLHTAGSASRPRPASRNEPNYP
jgi:glycosyltransferase involved in cell wall biosynthesis